MSTEPLTREQLEAVRDDHEGHVQHPDGACVVARNVGLPRCLPWLLADTALAALKRADEAEARMQKIVLAAHAEGHGALASVMAALDGGQPAPEAAASP